ncbi:DinB family protein [Paenibacillus doosanensis]|uniref:DinB superfamily protein n=1 Tax=Paenibacillus konkukensis TaxID=2020716 RepID=A0ABY4RFA5_9BACL|nr:MULTISPECIES: DinB family protein [Paenibacillus]MCS7460529.1 DinB family protein [Paenibacillus doosanensis]UQZ81249.1 DinB superfamily protein [Paenibacillus konkukensis]
MNTTEIMQNLEKWTNYYIEELDGYSEDQLKLKPSEEAWSLGQMYVHLIQTALYMQLKNAEQCRIGSEAEGDPAETEMPVKSEVGEAVFNLGGFPPMRIQVPASPQYTPSQAESKQQLVDGLQAVLRRAGELAPAMNEASPHYKIAHPRLGGLNAAEWFALVEMHYRHHLLQKERLQAFIAECQ